MIQHFLITVLVIYGIHGTTRGGMIFDLKRVDTWMFKRLKGKYIYLFDNIFKALFDCTPCMASIYGTISFFILVDNLDGLIYLPVWVFSLSGFNYILNKVLNK
jgi:hypothetical protein